MKEDLSRYDPNIAQVLEETTPEQIKERRRKAVQKLVDEGIIDRETPSPEAQPDAETGTSAPSPWAKDGGGTNAGLDPSALPSALTPAGPPVEERPVTRRVRPEPARWRLPWKQSATFALIAVAVAVVGAILLDGQSREASRRAEAMAASAVAMARAAAPPSTTAMTSLGATVMPSATGTVMTSAAVMTSATVMPSATTSPASSGTKARSKPTATSADPYDTAPAPSPPVTVAPQAPAAPSSPASVAEPKPSAPAPATDADPFLHKRHQ